VTDADLPNPIDAEPLPADDHYQPPRLSILHLLLWTTVAAVLFKFNMAVTAVITGVIAGMGGRVFATSIVNRAIAPTYVIMYAAGFVGLGVLVASRIRGRPGRLQPGHWMLVVVVPLYAATRIPDIALVLTHLIQQGTPSRLPFWYMQPAWAPLVVPGLCRAALYSWASIRTIDGRRWRALFVCLAILAAIMALGYALLWSIFFRLTPGMIRFLILGLPIPVNAVVCLTLLAVILVDLRVPRDWLHWLGIALVGGGAALELLRGVCQVYFPI
jgi:hypothetical protein